MAENKGILPSSTFNTLGNNNNKWEAVYANKLVGPLTGNAATATKATQDSAGQQINTTYIKSLSVSGKTITYTKGNGTTGTITTKDTVYTLPAASSSTLGGIRMSYGTNDLSAGSSSLATGALYFVYE